MQNSALFLWLALSLQLITKPSLSFAQVNAALGYIAPTKGNIMQWIMVNKEWVFSGIGVLLVSVLVTIVLNYRRKPKKNRKILTNHQIQKSGKNSNNYQAQGDINIGSNNDK